MAIEIKICGLTSDEAIAAALEAQVDLIGFVFFPRSPRNLTLDEARRLAEPVRGRATVVALIVDEIDRRIAEMVERFSPDLIQLHGRETPERVADIRAFTGRPVMKAVSIAEPADLRQIAAHAPVADRLLVDAKPPKTPGALPGGNGLAFDWRLVRGLDPGRPVMLSGGLDASNVARAIEVSGLSAVDVSSGVERAPGTKDPELIRAFCRNARAARLPERPVATPSKDLDP
jgi:phosphoribosylanthranilate isomerase